EIQKQAYDLIISDYTLPTINGREALRLAAEYCPGIPFIFLSGTLGEDAAIQSLLDGATDYVLKSSLKRLAPSVKRALEETSQRKARDEAESALRRSEERLRFALEAAQMGVWDFNLHSGEPEAFFASAQRGFR